MLHDDEDHQEGVRSAPDARFLLANERTFLAWNRTALALVAAGLAVTQLLQGFHLHAGRVLLGLPLILLGGLVAYLSYNRFTAVEHALEQGRRPPPTSLPRLLTVVTVVGAALAAVLAALGSEG